MNPEKKLQLLKICCFIITVSLMTVFTWEVIAFLQYQNRIAEFVSPTYYTAKYLLIGYIPLVAIILALGMQQLTIRKVKP